MRWQLGHVGHFGLAVRDPKTSARWWIENLGLREAFEFEGGVAVETDAVTIVLREGAPLPGTLGHLAFHLKSVADLKAALADLTERGVAVEDPGDEIGPEAPGSRNVGIWFHDPDGYRWELSVQNGLAQLDSEERQAT